MTGATPPALIHLDGATLRCAQIDAVARRGAGVRVDPAARVRVADAHGSVELTVVRRPVYGRTTGVGAQRHDAVPEADLGEHGSRLLRSHAACVGPLEDRSTVRATLLVRLNQLLSAGAGVRPEVVDALAAALREGAVPNLHRWGAVGTGDLSSLAELALTLAGELPWAAGGLPPVVLDSGDALALISSNALTVATAALAAIDLAELLRAATVVGALSFCALEGSWEAYDEQVHDARPYPGALTVAADLRALLGHPALHRPARRLQDPYGLRAVPQVAGAATGALADLARSVEVEVNAAVENPLVRGDDIFHHGGFHTAELALALDRARAALLPVAALSTARLGDLLDPQLSGLPAFLATGPSGSSGVMILEYIGQDLLAELRALTAPHTAGSAVLSLGLEEHASFSTQGARAAVRAAELFAMVLATELIAAIRALRAAPERLLDAPVGAAFDLCAAQLPAETEDRLLGPDLTLAAALLPRLAQLTVSGQPASSGVG
ncbi:MAG TPA: aromatic amino acid ammonia-lyase [Mycobacteriales bacterium]|nr:aromatic amino acid ammonia-lyase [Mycobacteriales bacterium]